MTWRACLNCGAPSPSPRCPDCTATHQQTTDRKRGGAHGRGYTRAWEKIAAQAMKEQPYCLTCGSTTDLTVDHVVPKAKGGTDDRHNLVTMCRRHNSSKGSR